MNIIMNPDTAYLKWCDHCKIACEDINLLKNSSDTEYMTEHDVLLRFKDGFIKYIDRFCNDYKIEKQQVYDCIQYNEKYGESRKNINDKYGSYNANSLRYLYMASMFVRYIVQNKKNNIDLLEIGGGYGGFAVIFIKLCDLVNIIINSYTMIDLCDVVKLQNKYINLAIPNQCKVFKFISYENLLNSKNDFKDCKYTFLFSSYSLSEISKNARKIYYDLFFKNMQYGMIFWNTEKIDLPDNIKYTWDGENPQTGTCNRIVFFSQK
jgi:hypothetical protein